jgi:putative flavoprotein involved in K+ transport
VDAFARDHRVEIVERTEVVGARRTPGGFAVAVSGGGEIPCRFLVIATGSASVPFYPEVPGIAGNPRVLHSGDFLNCMAYDRKRVLVIGGANSAAELCIELAGTAHTTMCTRGPLRYFSETGELDQIRGSSESVLKELFRFGILSLREADPVVSLSGGEAAFASGGRESFDWIVCATGYRPRWIPVEGGTVDVVEKGYPRISPSGESSVPGLYFCGSLAMFHPRCAFIHGFRNYVEKVFWDIADRL